MMLATRCNPLPLLLHTTTTTFIRPDTTPPPRTRGQDALDFDADPFEGGEEDPLQAKGRRLTAAEQKVRAELGSPRFRCIDWNLSTGPG
jgi:hypothetical protein